jgi:plasmid stabilization system protein ParE
LARVVFAETAQADLDEVFAWIADRAGERVALGYSARIAHFCREFIPFPHRGTMICGRSAHRRI